MRRRRDRHRLLRGRPRAFEYHDDPEKTKGSRDPKGRGWSTLGDVGYLDDDGFLYLTDRKAYMIISGGVNIYPQEAENVLAMHPKVADVAVFGIPDEEMGEAVHAVVQPADGRRGHARGGRRAHRLLPRPARPLQVPALGRLPRRAAPPPHRQALQAPAQGRVLDVTNPCVQSMAVNYQG